MLAYVENVEKTIFRKGLTESLIRCGPIIPRNRDNKSGPTENMGKKGFIIQKVKYKANGQTMRDC